MILDSVLLFWAILYVSG